MRLAAVALLAALVLVACGDDRSATPGGSGDQSEAATRPDVEPLEYKPGAGEAEEPPPVKPAKPVNPDQALLDSASKKMKSDDYEVRAGAVLLLQDAKDKSAAGRLLVELLYDPEEEVREMAATALGKLKYSGGVEALRGLLGKEQETTVRKSAVQSLFAIGGESVVPDLVNVLRDDGEDDIVKAVAAGLLGDSKSKAGEEALLNALEDFDENVRLAAVTSVRKRNIAGAGEKVIELTEDASVLVRAEAALALGEMGVKKGVPALIDLLDPGENMQVLENATRSLCTLTGVKKGMQYAQDADSDEKAAVLKAWEDWWQEHKDEY